MTFKIVGGNMNYKIDYLLRYISNEAYKKICNK